MKKPYTGLSPKEKQLCIYIKQGLKSKEIAKEMGVLSGSVDVLRTRMRKKYQIKGELRRWIINSGCLN